MNNRIKNAGIKITGVFIPVSDGGYWTLNGTKSGAYLEYRGKKIVRPKYEDCESEIKKQFNISI